MSILDFLLWGRKADELFSPPEPTLDGLKQKTRVLFIDDKEFAVVDILKKNGWLTTELISDIENIDDPKICGSHVIFVDIHGVGRAMGFADEGLGLVKALKDRFPEKRIVVYSAESSGDRFNDGLAIADMRLRKNADPIQFLTLVEQYSRDAFSLNNCVIRLQKLLRDEFSLSLTREEIVSNISKLRSSGNVTESAVSKIFDVDKAGSIASIIGLLLSAYGRT